MHHTTYIQWYSTHRIIHQRPEAQHTQVYIGHFWSFDRRSDGVIRVVCSESAAEATTTTDTAAQTCVETLSSF